MILFDIRDCNYKIVIIRLIINLTMEKLNKDIYNIIINYIPRSTLCSYHPSNGKFTVLKHFANDNKAKKYLLQDDDYYLKFFNGYYILENIRNLKFKQYYVIIDYINLTRDTTINSYQ